MVAIKIGGCYECGIGTLLMNFQKSGFLIIYFKKAKKLKSTNQSINSTGNCEGLLFFFLFQKQNLVPSLPIIKDRHFIIPTEYSDFCLFDSVVMNPIRIIVFDDRDNVHALRVQKFLWLCDGTFKICPMQFYQLYTIHIQIFRFYPPCLYALLPEQTYSKFLKVIISVSDNAQPSRILLDFERAAVNAFTSAFPESSIVGCYFHTFTSVRPSYAKLTSWV